MPLRGRALVAGLCLAQLANLLSHVAVPAVMAQHLVPLWKLSATQAGLMASAYTLGYMVAVPLLVPLTDRIDARIVLFGGSLTIAVAVVGFGLFADGLRSAALLWGVAGIGGAGTYMPGLRSLTDRLPKGGDVSRSITFYTASFSVAVGLSFLCSQVLADAIGWRRTFVFMGLAPITSMVIAALIGPAWPTPQTRSMPAFRAVLRNRPAMGFILGYGAHCFELYGFRTWIVTFWGHVATRDGGTIVTPAVISLVASLLAFPASVLGNESAVRFGRRRYIVGVMLLSAGIAFAIAANAAGPPTLLLVLVLLYALTLQGDSGALTAGMAISARDADRGATMALHSMIGFAMAALGSTAVGFAIDAAGGSGSDVAWSAAFAVMGAGIVIGPIAIFLKSRPVDRLSPD